MADIEIDIASPILIDAGTEASGTVSVQSILDPAIVLEMVSQPAVVEMILPESIAVELGFTYSPPVTGGGETAPEGGVTVKYEVAYPMSGHRFVVLDENQRAIYADNSVPSHAIKLLGMTLGATSSGLTEIQTAGPVEEPSWNWTLDIPVWLSTSGLMAQVPPISGFSMIVAFPISTTKMFIRICTPIILE